MNSRATFPASAAAVAAAQAPAPPVADDAARSAGDASGRPSDLREVFAAHHAFIYRSARRLGVSLGHIDDVVQETFIVAGRKLAGFEGRSSLRTWLFGILLRVAETARRGEARHQRRTLAAAQHAVGSHDPYARQEAADLLHRLLEGLDDDRRVAFILADFEGLTAVEIAEGFGVNLNTVYSRIRSARKQVEQALQRMQEREAGGPWNP